jgi:hypothetical protein
MWAMNVRASLLLLPIVLAACHQAGGAAMTEQPPDISMLTRRAGSGLVDSQLALTIAETLFRNEIGDERLKRQLPLQVSDLGQSWLVKGTPNPLNPGRSPTGLVDAYTEIVISKADCRIIRFATVGGFP